MRTGDDRHWFRLTLQRSRANITQSRAKLQTASVIAGQQRWPGRIQLTRGAGSDTIGDVSNLRIRQAAELLGVSDDTVRRWINQGTLAVSHDAAGRKVIASEDLARFSRTNAPAPPADPLSIGSSARNRFVGLVTSVVSDKVMTQVEMQCGPFTVVSLMSTEAADELQLRPGSVAVAVVKATTVIVETARPSTAVASD